MAFSRAAAAVAVLLLSGCLLPSAPVADSHIVCGQVLSYVYRCVPYVRGRGGHVPAACCRGLRRLKRAARTTGDRRAACRCLMTASLGAGGAKPGLVSGITGKCGIYLPYPIGPHVDCARIP